MRAFEKKKGEKVPEDEHGLLLIGVHALAF